MVLLFKKLIGIFYLDCLTEQGIYDSLS